MDELVRVRSLRGEWGRSSSHSRRMPRRSRALPRALCSLRLCASACHVLFEAGLRCDLRGWSAPFCGTRNGVAAPDLATIESFNASFETEPIHRTIWEIRKGAKGAMCGCIETRYDTKRLSSTLGYRSPGPQLSKGRQNIPSGARSARYRRDFFPTASRRFQIDVTCGK